MNIRHPFVKLAALAALVTALPLMMAPSGGYPTRPIFQSVRVGVTADPGTNNTHVHGTETADGGFVGAVTGHASLDCALTGCIYTGAVSGTSLGLTGLLASNGLTDNTTAATITLVPHASQYAGNGSTLFGWNVGTDGTNFLTGTDGGSNGGWVASAGYGSTAWCLQHIVSTGGTRQSVPLGSMPACLMQFDVSGNLTFPGAPSVSVPGAKNIAYQVWYNASGGAGPSIVACYGGCGTPSITKSSAGVYVITHNIGVTGLVWTCSQANTAGSASGVYPQEGSGATTSNTFTIDYFNFTGSLTDPANSSETECIAVHP